MALLVGSTSACSSSSSPAQPVVDGGGGGDTGGGGGTMATIKGTTVSFGSMGKPLPNETIKASGQTATSDAKGAWSLTFAKNTPFSLVFSAPMTAGFTEQEAFLTGDSDLGNTDILDAMTAGLLTSTFPSYDSTQGVLAIAAESSATTCPANDPASNTIDHATFSVDAPGADGGAIKYIYLRGGLPNTTATDSKAGEIPAAVAYNVPTGVDLKVTVTHPTCKPAAFPVTVGPVTYTGKVQVVAGLATSYLRAFLK